MKYRIFKKYNEMCITNIIMLANISRYLKFIFGIIFKTIK